MKIFLHGITEFNQQNAIRLWMAIESIWVWREDFFIRKIGDRWRICTSGAGDEVTVLHVPGHTRGSIVCYHPREKSLFTGDFVYDCGDGGDLFDWLPTSSIGDYLRSANYMLDWLQEHDVEKIYPGHFRILNDKNRVRELLGQYIHSKEDCCSRSTASCLQTLTRGFFKLGCFRCCPC